MPIVAPRADSKILYMRVRTGGRNQAPRKGDTMGKWFAKAASIAANVVFYGGSIVLGGTMLGFVCVAGVVFAGIATGTQ